MFSALPAVVGKSTTRSPSSRGREVGETQSAALEPNDGKHWRERLRDGCCCRPAKRQGKKDGKTSAIPGPGAWAKIVQLVFPCLRPRPSNFKVGDVVIVGDKKLGQPEYEGVVVHIDGQGLQDKVEIRKASGNFSQSMRKHLRAKGSIASAYQGFLAGVPWHRQFLNNMRYAWYHVCRSVESHQLTNDVVFSPSEQEFMCSLYPWESEFKRGFATGRILAAARELPSCARAQETPVINFVVWRRSALYVLFVLSCVFTYATYGNMNIARNVAQEYAAKGVFEVDFAAWSEQHLAELPKVPCSEIDGSFADFLITVMPYWAALPYSGVTMKDRSVTSCQEVLERCPDCCPHPAGIAINNYVAELSTCGWKGICDQPLADLCPHACSSASGATTASPMCNDTRGQSEPTYLKFSKEFVRAMAYRLRAETAEIDVVKTYLITVAQFLALVGVGVAVATWSFWRRSWRVLLAAWALTFLTPVVVSTVPSRLFITWGTIDTELLEFIRLTRDHYNVEQKITNLTGQAGEVCNKRISELKKNWTDVRHKIRKVCDIMDIIDVPIMKTDDEGRKACAKLRKAGQRVGNGLELVLQACDRFNSMWQSSQTGAVVAQIYEVIREATAKAKVAVEVSIGFSNALSSFAEMWPAAISLAPGLIKAALRSKKIVPEASIPGIFVILLPWLYTPLSWTLYNIFMQMVGNVYLLMALVLFAFYPMAYSLVGGWFNIAMPMEVRKMDRAMRLLTMCTQSILLVSAGLMVAAVYRIGVRMNDESDLLGSVLERMLNEVIANKFSATRTLAVMMLSFATKLYLTTVTGVDWMLRETAEQRMYETLRKEKSKLEDELEGSIFELEIKRKLHLDGLVVLSRYHIQQAAGPSGRTQ